MPPWIRSPEPGTDNAGQDCTAATRVLASKGVYDDVVSGLATFAGEQVVGHTYAPEDYTHVKHVMASLD